MSRRSPLRALLVLTLGLGLGGPSLLVSGCGKKGSGDSTAPGGAGGGSDAKGQGEAMRYGAEARKLKQSTTVSLTLSGPQSGSMKADIVGVLDVTGSGADKLKVAYSIAEVRDFTLSGALAPKPKEGEEPKDLKAELAKAAGAEIVDLRGVTDEDATKALAENKKGDDSIGESVGEFLGLPQLPEPALTAGAPIKKEKEDTIALGGSLKIPVDEESTYTLIAVRDEGGKKVAEIKFESEASGAVDAPQGGGMITVDTASEGTIFFNLDDKIPVRVHIEQTQSFGFGDQGGESQIVIDSTYEPA